MMMKKAQYFTMVELLAVIVIIMILAGILIGGIGYATKKADIAKAKAKMTQLEVALDLFKTEYGYYPPTGAEEFMTVHFYMKDDKLHLYLFNEGQVTKDDTKLSQIFNFCKRGTSQPLLEIGIEGAWNDAWENPFLYKYPGKSEHNANSYDLWSEGPDDTKADDDITNWNMN